MPLGCSIATSANLNNTRFLPRTCLNCSNRCLSILFKNKTKSEQNDVHHIVRRSYGNHYRRMITPLLNTLEFHCNNQYRPVIDALHYLKINQQQRGIYFNDSTDIPTQGIIKPKWLDTVIEKQKDGTTRINRINYEISVLHALREGL